MFAYVIWIHLFSWFGELKSVFIFDWYGITICFAILRRLINDTNKQLGLGSARSIRWILGAQRTIKSKDLDRVRMYEEVAKSDSLDVKTLNPRYEKSVLTT